MYLLCKTSTETIFHVPDAHLTSYVPLRIGDAQGVIYGNPSNKKNIGSI
jgi:hypothetical protein